MAEFPSLPLWTDAYLADTIHLDTRQHGAYMLLLITAWRSPDCSLPDNDKILARYARMDQRGWRSMRPILEQFFTVSQGKWTQKRLQKERNYVEEQSRRNSENAKARWLNKNKVDNATAMRNSCETDAPTPTPTPIVKKGSLQEPKESTPPVAAQPPPAPCKPKRLGTRLPDDWEPSPDEIRYARDRGFDDDHIRDIAENFRDHWTNGTGRNKTHVDWTRTWQGWIRRESPRAGRAVNGHASSRNRQVDGGLVGALRRNINALDNVPRPRQRPYWDNPSLDIGRRAAGGGRSGGIGGAPGSDDASRPAGGSGGDFQDAGSDGESK